MLTLCLAVCAQICASQIPTPTPATPNPSPNPHSVCSAWFNDPEVLLAVFNIYHTCSNQQLPLRVVAANCLALLLRWHCHLLPRFIEKVGVSVVVQALEESHIRIQMSGLTLLALCVKENPPRLLTALLKEKRLVSR